MREEQVADTLSNLLSSVSGSGGVRSARGRSAAFGAVIAHAACAGIEEAIHRFGGSLSEADKATLRALGPEELATLSRLQCDALRAAACSG
jgi:hypothetical protein